jgi:hypothetical protein
VWLRTNAPAGRGHQSRVGIGSNWGFIFTYSTKTVEKGAWGHRKQPAWARTDVRFEWRDDNQIKIPDVFLVIVAVALSVCPWIPWSRKFSLRTLLIATMLIAVLLGLVVYVTSS